MKVTSPWRCDFCKSLKSESNGWIIGILTTKNKRPSIQFTTWSDAEAERPNVKHICGIRCAVSFLQAEAGALIPATFQPSSLDTKGDPQPFVSPNQAAEDEAIEKAKFDRVGDKSVDIDIAVNPTDQKWE